MPAHTPPAHVFPAKDWHRLVSERRRSLAPPEHYVRKFVWEGLSHVADLGAGPGYFTRALLSALGPGGRLTAVDLQPAMLGLLEARLGSDPRIARAAASLDALPFADGSFDGAWCAFVAHELPDRARAFAEVRRVLRAGARFVVLDWEPVEGDHGPPLEKRVAASEVRDAMASAGFRVEAPIPVTSCQFGLVGR